MLTNTAATTIIVALFTVVATLPVLSAAWCINTGTSCLMFAENRRHNRALSATTTSGAIASSPLELSGQPASNISPTKPATSPRQHSIHLLSLPPKNDTFSLPGESLVRECWRWKDTALGDGRDYFVPRPRALKAFHSLFVGMEISTVSPTIGDPLEVVFKFQSDEGGQSLVEVRLPLSQFTTGNILQQPSNQHYSFSETFTVEECVALSNCARFDVILVLRRAQHDKNNEAACIPGSIEQAEIAAKYAVAYHLQQQIVSQRSKSTSLLERTGLSSWLDLPSAINLEMGSSSNSVADEQQKQTQQLAQRLTSMEGAHSISTHLSLIAGGLAPRPNRPDREVIFRPYSSRDAHILLQLKRTVEVVSVVNEKNGIDGIRGKNTKGSGGRGRIKTLLDGALSAGKAARNEDIVPDIKKLKEYGSDGTPPVALANIVAKAAVECAVKPSVETCVSRLAAMETDTTEQISQMRQRINDIVASISNSRGDDFNANCQTNNRLQKMANKLLHAPTMELREGKLFSVDEMECVVQEIEKQLNNVIAQK